MIVDILFGSYTGIYIYIFKIKIVFAYPKYLPTKTPMAELLVVFYPSVKFKYQNFHS